MKKIIINLILFLILFTKISEAEEPVKYVGAQFDLGVPDGFGLGLVVKPKVSWLRINVSGTYNLIAPGVRGGITIDPIDYVISPILSFEAGGTGRGTIPYLNRHYDISYNYINFHTGVEFGNKNKWKIFLHLGPSLVNIKTYNFANSIDNSQKLLITDPLISLIGNPTFKFGAVYFF